MSQYQQSHLEADGYGVYEFTPRPGGVFGAVPDLTSILSNMDAHIDKSSGIQVLKPDLQASAIQGLDENSDFIITAESGQVKMGTIEAGWNKGGDDWASNYVSSGFAVLVDKTTIESSSFGLGGTAQGLVTNAPSYITDNARVGGDYVVVSAHPELVAKAAALLTAGPPGGEVPSGPVVEPAPPGGTPDLPAPPVPIIKQASSPEWLWPAIVAVGGLTLVAYATTVRKK